MGTDPQSTEAAQSVRGTVPTATETETTTSCMKDFDFFLYSVHVMLCDIGRNLMLAGIYSRSLKSGKQDIGARTCRSERVKTNF
jgi:hypothetical protein